MPDSRTFLTAKWLHLAMLNYEVEPTLLEKHVPAGTELNPFNGRTFVSVVGFRFRDTRLLGVPIPFHRNFPEVNLRFYVHRDVGNERRHGVVFIKEIVPRAAVAWVARWAYNENFVALPMKHWNEIGRDSELRVGYQWKHGGRWHGLCVRATGEPYLPDEGSEEAFITEHHWGYTSQRNGATLEYHVDHPQWHVRRVTEAELDCDVASVYGPEFAPYLSAAPHSAFFAEGSVVAVRRGQFLAQ